MDIFKSFYIYIYMQGITNAQGAWSTGTRPFFTGRGESRGAGSGGGKVLTKNIWLQLDEASLHPGSPELRLYRPRNSECTRI